MQTTLILLKPDCLAKGHCGEVVQRFEKAGFRIRGCKMMRLTGDLLREHYAHIAAKPFFPEVEAFMQSSPVIAMAFEAEGVIEKVRALAGPTDSKKAAPGTIRGDFGVDVMVNVVHASDSLENAQVELARFFQPGELFANALVPPGWHEFSHRDVGRIESRITKSGCSVVTPLENHHDQDVCSRNEENAC